MVTGLYGYQGLYKHQETKDKRTEGLDPLLDHLPDEMNIMDNGNVAEVTSLQTVIYFKIWQFARKVIGCISPNYMLSLKLVEIG